MKRCLFVILSAISFLACICTLVIWDRSYLASEWAMYGRADPLGNAFLVRGASIRWDQGVISLKAYRVSDCPRRYANPEGFGFQSISNRIFPWQQTAVLVPQSKIATMPPRLRPRISTQIANGSLPLEPGTRICSILGFTLFTNNTAIQEQGSATPFPRWTGGLSFPCWSLVVLTALLPALWLLRLRHWYLRRQRMRRGLCACCGYDLRASKDRCPECGESIPLPRPAKMGLVQRWTGRPMGYWLIHAGSAISLLFFLATLVLWVRSHRSSDYLDWRWRSHTVPVPIFRNDCWVSTQGILGYGLRIREEYQSDSARKYPAMEWTQAPPPVWKTWGKKETPGWELGGFGHQGQADSTRWEKIHQGVWFYTVPHWAVALTTSLLPTLWLWRQFRLRRNRTGLARGLCPTCAYDLRASKGKCPECGNPIPLPSVKATEPR